MSKNQPKNVSNGTEQQIQLSTQEEKGDGEPQQPGYDSTNPGPEQANYATAAVTSTSTDGHDPNKEVVWEIKTYNYTLLLVGLLIGMSLGYVLWIFIREDLVFWAAAAVGLLVARILETTKFPQNVVKIWSPKSTESMLFPPSDWRNKEGIGRNAALYLQSDMYDDHKHYLRTTAVYHHAHNCALAIRERFVYRNRGFKQLMMGTPYATAMITTASLILSICLYLRGSNAGANISVFFLCFLVVTPLLILLGCLIELELRKMRFFSFAQVIETVTYIPLHAIGRIHRQTIGGDFWRLFYLPPEASSKSRKIRKMITIITLPFLLVFQFLVSLVMLTTYNGAFAVWLCLCIATILMYQTHIYKDTSFVEPTMTMLWVSFVVNVFEIWYCAPANGCGDTVGQEPNQLRKLELDSEKRIPKNKVRKLVLGFSISLVLIFISAVAMTAITHSLYKDVEFFGIDKSWETQYKANKKFIFCDEKETRRMLGEIDLNGERESPNVHLVGKYLFDDRASNVLKSKYTSDYDALCDDNNFHASSVAIAFCTIDWFFLLVLIIYWHVNDKYQTRITYNPKERSVIWHDSTRFFIHGVPSKITWFGRIIGQDTPHSYDFFIHPSEANLLHRYLTENVPWYSHLNPAQPGARELMPR